MSGHNHPSSWNLPVPSYIPRQPQLAHMSNDHRPLSSWHTAAPPEALYPFIAAAANHKNPMELNPLLPPFVRTPTPFGTMDLSVPSAARNNSTPPPPRNIHSPIMSNSNSLAPPPQIPSDFSNKSINRNPSPGVIQPNPSAKDKSSISPSNGELLPPCSTNSGLYVRDAKQINNDIGKMSRDPIGLPPMNEPMELIKEAIYQQESESSKSRSPQKVLDLNCGGAAHQESVITSHNSMVANLSVMNSNDESTESVTGGGRKRRKRKPNKTSRMSNESSDDLILMNGSSVEENSVPLVGEGEDKDVEETNSVSHEESQMNKNEEQKREKANNSPNKSPSKKLLDETINKKRRSRRSKDDEKMEESGNDSLEIQTNAEESRKGEEMKNVSTKNNQEEIPSPEKSVLVAPMLNSTATNDQDTSFEEVENKLEEMFAGIEDDDERRNEKVSKPVKKRSKTSPTTIKENGLNVLEDEEFPLLKDNQEPKPKKRRPPAKKPANGKAKKKTAKNGKGKFKKSFPEDEFLPKKAPKEPQSEEPKHRGPYVQVKKDGSLIVINAPQLQAEDDPEKQNSIKVKKFPLGEKSRVRGLHVSTLSTKYDAERTDTSWMCIFCKLGPHKMGLGDLFGPYFVSTTCDEFILNKFGPDSDEFKSKRTKKDMVQKAPHFLPIVPAGTSTMKSPELKSPKKGKKKEKTDASTTLLSASAGALDESRLYMGMTKVSDTSYEIWLHEDCTFWAPGLNMIAGRLIGLEGSVWGSSRNQCDLCEKNGATVFCLERGCSNQVHVPCARQSNWHLSHEELKSYCQTHSKEMQSSS